MLPQHAEERMLDGVPPPYAELERGALGRTRRRRQRRHRRALAVRGRGERSELAPAGAYLL
ncbi:hypothetical protein FE633_35425 [Streptomyces montanus]|uniref:Uncharacterized protein n=1 Tax=Streptomyces montanus TaxID=2580423 RepID=A0A5R9FQ04_9ACTN|nr:hypothetical protein [Streptomyces montanus]TLS41595.1 hypothetical protein FE633_35425 [Streptomyces montanus]